ncbi:polyketide cyclase [Roseateles chitinivorans]|uniref:Polyketide cyclase n=1 Tax=Roseateles chitinivorans TaxID=2917965 RepID=A0A2G9CD06_9BURK|nr:SRPBCC family protein [Roseateles chitinivorans]PIM54293.1 polyketide cyclase [Roseateles chitinivorans]
MPFTLRLHRVLKAPPERVYRAFTDPAAMCKWLPPHGFTGTMHHMEPKVGGSWRMSFTNLSAGATHTFGGDYLELQPGQRLRYTSKFDDPNLRGLMTTTVELTPVFCGTEMQITQEGIPDVIPSQACHLGWQESLALLTQLVEPDIPNG